MDEAVGRLVDALLRDAGLQAIVDAAAEALGNPCYVGDARFKVLALSAWEDVDDENWRYIEQHRYCSVAEMRELQSLGVDRSVRMGAGAVRVTFPSSRYAWVTQVLSVDARAIGYFGLVECRGVLDERKLALFGEACRVVACELQKGRYGQDALHSSHEHFLLDLIAGQLASREKLATARELCRVECQAPYQMLVVGSKDKSAWIPELARMQLENVTHADISVEANGMLALLLWGSHVDALAAARGDRVRKALASNRLLCGASMTFEDLAEGSDRFEEARVTLGLCAALGEGEALLVSSDPRVYPFGTLLSGNRSLDAYVHPSLRKLGAYDREHGSELVRTLKTYMQDDSNIAQTARDLYMHRNAIDYRLRRIEEIIGERLSDPSVSATLWLSLQAMALAKPHQSLEDTPAAS